MSCIVYQHCKRANACKAEINMVEKQPIPHGGWINLPGHLYRADQEHRLDQSNHEVKQYKH